MIFNSITTLFSDDCINAFKAAGLKDPFTIVNGTGVVVGPASLSTNPSNLGYMGIPEQSRKEILENFSSYDAKAFTVRGPLTSDGRARIFLNNSALGSLDELVGYMAHEFIHVAGVKGIKPPWYKPWQDDLSFDSKYQKIIDTCQSAARRWRQ